MPRENKTKYAVLGLLTYMPLSGYDIRRIYEQSLGNFWSESYGHIYPILKRLVDEGLATVEAEVREARPGRKVYTITPQGREEMHRWLGLPADAHRERVEVLLKVFLSWETGPDDAIAHVSRFRGEHEALLGKYAGYAERIAAEGAPGSPYWLLTVRCGQLTSAAMLAWCDEALGVLQQLPREGRAGDDRPLEVPGQACPDDASPAEHADTGETTP
jgi:PadR family transcriptional regulator AphA